MITNSVMEEFLMITNFAIDTVMHFFLDRLQDISVYAESLPNLFLNSPLTDLSRCSSGQPSPHTSSEGTAVTAAMYDYD
jgi:hypothetical protein